MKSIRFGLSIALILFSITVVLAESPADKSFAELKTLIGSWEGSASDGKVLRVAFRSTGAGSALVSEFHRGGSHPEDMITVFHRDGDRLVATHYCTAGNQPRMAAIPSAGSRNFAFEFFDATNLLDTNGGHMQRLVLSIVDANHHTERWTYIDHGKETTEVDELRRVIVNK